ncbi:MAG: DUF3048 domain-containing protein [Trueperaceae bacterium]
MESLRNGLRNMWHDADRRRALMLSVVAHLCALLLFVLWLSHSRPVPLEQFLVIDLGTPEQSEQVVNAPTVDDPAPPTPTPQVAEEEAGEPQARTAERNETVAPDPQELTQQPDLAPPAQPTTQPTTEAQAEVDAEQLETQPETPPEQQPENLPSPPEEVQAETSDAPIAPAPQVREPEPQTAADLPVATTATVLPEVDEVELAPRPAEQAIRIPQPQATASVPQARTVSVTPAVEVAAPQDIPAPSASARVAAATAVSRPSATANVAPARTIPQPSARASVAAAGPVPTPNTSVQVAQAVSVPLPGAQAEVAQARPVTVAAQAVVSRPVSVPAPTVRAQVTAPEPEFGAAMAGAAPEGSAANPSNRLDDRPAGGNAGRPGQDRIDDNASAENLGRATDTAPGAGDGAQALRPRVPYREERERPLAVLLDNAAGYPQAGLTEASLIAEMPVEGGMTRLMALYDRIDPAQVGPIRSARDYFVELAQGYDGVLVHDGGSPAALAAIDRSTLPTLNAFRFGDLFSRQQARQAPYNLYSSGGSLRDAVNRLQLERSQETRGVVPRPPEDAPDAQTVEVRFGGTYRSGFAYIQELDIYRWRRNGENAVDHRGEPVFVEAVLIARIEVRPIPDDPAGRLYIPLRGGDATLHLRGKAIEGRWLPAQGQDGVTFERDDGELMDLAPFRMWLLFAPTYAQVAGD